MPDNKVPVGRPASPHRWLREPLVLFLAAGIALFAGYSALQPAAAPNQALNRIELTEGDLRQLAVAWMAQWKRPPTTEELKGLLDGRIREEILYREALAMGLDKDDTIVKRRLAQKMEFLAEDMSALRDPSIDELKTWFAANGERFALQGRVSFHHLYFSVDKRGSGAEPAAMVALQELQESPDRSVVAARVGDPFMFLDYYGDRSPKQVADVFGTAFAGRIFELKPESWQGPIKSGLGVHLVWVTSLAPSRVPAFEEVEAIVRSEWIDEQREAAKAAAFEAMRARYEVLLPPALMTEAPDNAEPQGAASR
jgi:peptidyl-prolyl cis-trans isomerase C